MGLDLRRPALAFFFLFVLSVTGAGADGIVDARYEAPVVRYGHFAAGRPHEYSRVVATTDTGRKLALDLPESEVFEDLAPRLISLAQGEPTEILAIVSSRDGGSRLVLIGLAGARLDISAQSAAIGTPMRWLNPVGVADLDGDGRAEIAAVVTPHIGGVLKVYRRKGKDLVVISELGGFSNHAYGSTELGLSTPMSLGGRMRLLVPDASRRVLRIVGMEGGRLVESGRCALSTPVVGGIRILPSSEISIGLAGGRQVIDPNQCAR
jgi:hypothetical protein